MSTSVMHMPIPSYKPANRLCIFNTRASKLRCISGLRNSSFQCNATTSIQMPTTRRSGNYRPSLWDFNYIQSLNSGYTEERYLTRASELIKQVQMLLEEEMEPVRMLELIDDLQRLGISYHFEEKFDQMLNGIYKNFETEERDLYSTSLGFRLLRQHGFRVSQEVFDCFKNEKGDFEPALGENTKGLLQLYEASFLLTEGEKTLELAKEFAISLLRKKLDEEQGIDEGVSLLIRRALELPIHWRTQRPNARWFIDAYERKPDMNPIVLELAKLDFNIVQTTHQVELKHVSRWWNSTRLAEKLPFARDRLVESHFWTIGIVEPRQYGYQRIKLAETIALINVIDDIFDVYGTFEELQLFTDAVQRWDIESINQLPEYMQICYLALYNFVNEMAYDVLVEKGFNIIAYLRKSWTDLIQAYLQEAKWYYNGYKPNLEEYLNNAWISITTPVILPQIYFQLINSIEKEAVESLYEYHDIIRVSGIILRLADDLGTSTDEMERGDVPKAVQCYMNERNVSEQEAREYVKFLMEETWEKLNKERVSDSPFPKDFTACPVNVVRIAQFMYQYGDGHGMQHPEIHDQITKLLFEPYA